MTKAELIKQIKNRVATLDKRLMLNQIKATLDHAIKTIDAKMDEGDKWITTESGSHILLDKDGTIKGGAGGKFNGQPLSSMGGTKKFTKYETVKEKGEKQHKKHSLSNFSKGSEKQNSWINKEINTRHEKTVSIVNDAKRRAEFNNMPKEWADIHESVLGDLADIQNAALSKMTTQYAILKLAKGESSTFEDVAVSPNILKTIAEQRFKDKKENAKPKYHSKEKDLNLFVDLIRGNNPKAIDSTDNTQSAEKKILMAVKDRIGF